MAERRDVEELDLERLPKLLFRKWWDSLPVLVLFLMAYLPMVLWREILIDAWQGLRRRGGEKKHGT